MWISWCLSRTLNTRSILTLLFTSMVSIELGRLHLMMIFVPMFACKSTSVVSYTSRCVLKQILISIIIVNDRWYLTLMNNKIKQSWCRYHLISIKKKLFDFSVIHCVLQIFFHFFFVSSKCIAPFAPHVTVLQNHFNSTQCYQWS